MKIAAIGGAGGMGRYLCHVASSLPTVDQLIITDLSAARAREAAAQFERATPLALDLTDPAQLHSALAGVDVVVNMAGPFFRFGTTVLEAAIDAGCNYIDICDDWEPTLEMLGLDERARAAGVTAVIGMGASPGVSNLLAKLAADQLDDVEAVITGWNAEGAQPEVNDSPGVSAAIVHGIRQITGNVRVARESTLVDERPLLACSVDYPGVGRRRAYTFGHPEPVTLALNLNLRESVNVAFGSRPFTTAMRVLRTLVDRRLLSPDRAARLAQWSEHRMPAPDPAKKLFTASGLPPVFGLAQGTKDGRSEHIGVAALGFPGTSMGAATGVPTGVCLELMTRGEISRPGVFAPEACIDPAVFFAALAPRCVGNPSSEEMVLVTRSSDHRAAERYQEGVERARRRVLSS